MHRIVLFAALLTAACSSESTPQQNPTTPAQSTPAPQGQQPQNGPVEITRSIDSNGVGVLDVKGLAKADSPAAHRMELGKWLFFDPRMSKSGKTSCSTCHLPNMGWTDGKQLSTKDDGTVNKRHSPTLVNVGYCDKLYWDGRALSLEANVIAAWKGQMSADTLVISSELDKIPAYAEKFRAAFQTNANEENIGKALAAFVRMIKGENSAYDRYLAGNQDALSQDQKAGLDLFMGKAGCAVCHVPPLFTDKSFHNTGIGMDKENPDLGRGAHVKDPKLNGYFKTPSLRDVAKTAPYFHDGSIATLEEAVKFMASGGRDNPTKSPQLLDRKLNDGEVKAITAFLGALTSEVTFTPPTLPQ
jgi:cytochrome c peroxidase